MVFPNTSALVVCCLFMLLVVTMIGVEQVLEFTNFVADVHSLNVRIPQFSMLKLLLQVLEFFAGLVVEGMEEFLQSLLLPRIRHVEAHRL